MAGLSLCASSAFVDCGAETLPRNEERSAASSYLPEAFAQDPDRLARFQREAQVLASLNHPGIAAIYGLEDSGDTKALVLELVEGPTLADRIKRGPIALDEALPIAKQTAEALEAAHEAGVIHRDLKPANIKVRDDGTVKVLDFGLAKALDPSPTGDPSQSPTLTAMATQMGVIMGTAAYMSPEQARGKTVDKRTDIWAFGCVLFEMLIGERLFQGEDTSEVLARVIRDQPPWQRVPARMKRLLKKCLEKDSRRRLRDIGDAWELTGGDSPGDLPTASRNVRVPGGWAVAGVAMAALAGLGYAHFGEDVPAAEQVRFVVGGPAGADVAAVSVSPDGRHLAFVARNSNGDNQVWVRSLAAFESQALSGTEGAVRNGLFWSPDSRFIGFTSQGQLRKVELGGASQQTVCDVEGFLGGAWSPDGVIVFGALRGLMQVPDAGGTPSLLTAGGGGVLERDGYPWFLPDGRHFVYWRGSTDTATTGIYLGSLDTESEKQSSTPILLSGSPAVFARAPAGAVTGQRGDSTGGFVLFERQGSLMAQPFDTDQLALDGEAVFVAGDVTPGPEVFVGRRFSTSTTGVLAYRSGGAGAGRSRLLWYDREGGAVGQVGLPDAYGGIQLAPDGDHVVVDIRREAGVYHSWVGDLDREVFSRIKPGDVSEFGAVASAEGRVALTMSLDGGLGDIYGGVLNGAGTPELWVDNDNEKHSNHFSPDGRFLVYDEHHPTRRQDLWILPFGPDGKPSGDPIPFLITPADESFGQFSPDGRWIAYHSDESGRQEVFVRAFSPDDISSISTRREQVSTTGGTRPRWSHDGTELYYISADDYMMAVLVATEMELEPGVPVRLFEMPLVRPSFFLYDVGADGRFLINTAGESTEAGIPQIAVVTNWTPGP